MEYQIKTVKCYACGALIDRTPHGLNIIAGRGQSPICENCKKRPEYKHRYKNKQSSNQKTPKNKQYPNQKTIKIEKNIPIPKKIMPQRAPLLKPRKPRKPKYQFSKMEIMDSFFVKVRDKKHANQVRSNISTCLKRHNKYHKQNIKIATRYLTKSGGIRIWRIE